MDPEYLIQLALATSASNGTSLITYFVPPQTSLWLAANKLKQEYSTASNIKSRTVRKDVQDALKSAMSQIKLSESNTSDNGFVICAGKINIGHKINIGDDHSSMINESYV